MQFIERGMGMVHECFILLKLYIDMTTGLQEFGESVYRDGDGDGDDEYHDGNGRPYSCRISCSSSGVKSSRTLKVFRICLGVLPV